MQAGAVELVVFPGQEPLKGFQRERSGADRATSPASRASLLLEPAHVLEPLGAWRRAGLPNRRRRLWAPRRRRRSDRPLTWSASGAANSRWGSSRPAKRKRARPAAASAWRLLELGVRPRDQRMVVGSRALRSGGPGRRSAAVMGQEADRSVPPVAEHGHGRVGAQVGDRFSEGRAEQRAAELRRRVPERLPGAPVRGRQVPPLENLGLEHFRPPLVALAGRVAAGVPTGSGPRQPVAIDASYSTYCRTLRKRMKRSVSPSPPPRPRPCRPAPPPPPGKPLAQWPAPANRRPRRRRRSTSSPGPPAAAPTPSRGPSPTARAPTSTGAAPCSRSG